MNHEPDERPLNMPQAGPSFDPPFPTPARPPYGPGGPPHQQQQPIRPASPAEDELQARLRALRQRRQQTELGQASPPPVEFQRRGLPTPPNQPPLKDLL